MEHHLQVYGYGWGGSKICYQYSLKTEDAADLARSPNNVKRYAGDFESVIDWRLVSESNEYEGTGAITRRVTTFKTLRGFRNGMTPRRFDRIINGF